MFLLRCVEYAIADEQRKLFWEHTIPRPRIAAAAPNPFEDTRLGWDYSG